MSLPECTRTVFSEGDDESTIGKTEKLMMDLNCVEANLRTLSDAVRLIASQMMIKHQQSQVGIRTGKSFESDDTGSNTTAEETVGTDDDSAEPNDVLEQKNLSDILKDGSLAPLHAANLLALQNAVEMMQDHARLASEEAAMAVEDSIQAQAAARYWQKRALAAESNLQEVSIEATSLKLQNQKLVTERKVLIKEVRKIRKELADKTHETIWAQLESYVTSALDIHERQLKTHRVVPSATTTNTGESDGDLENSSKTPVSNSQGVNNVNQKEQGGASTLTVDVNGVRDGTPEKANKGSSSPAFVKSTPDSPGRLGDDLVMIDPAESFGSPITFLETPLGAEPAKYVEDSTFCDPQVLRSLALPSVDK